MPIIRAQIRNRIDARPEIQTSQVTSRNCGSDGRQGCQITHRRGELSLSQTREGISLVYHSCTYINFPRAIIFHRSEKARDRTTWADTQTSGEGGPAGIGHRRGAQDGKIKQVIAKKRPRRGIGHRGDLQNSRRCRAKEERADSLHKSSIFTTTDRDNECHWGRTSLKCVSHLVSPSHSFHQSSGDSLGCSRIAWLQPRSVYASGQFGACCPNSSSIQY